MMLTQKSQVRKWFIESKTEAYIQEKNRLIRSENRIENIKGWSIRLENWIKNVKGRSTSSEEAPEYFGTKRRLSLKISGSFKYHVWYKQLVPSYYYNFLWHSPNSSWKLAVTYLSLSLPQPPFVSSLFLPPFNYPQHHAIIAWINTLFCVLINLYWTGLIDI